MIYKYILNSYNRYSGSSSAPVFQFQQAIPASTVYVNKVTISHHWYTIVDSINDYIVWRDSNSTEIVTYLNPGNYSIDDLCTHIGTQMTADSVGESNSTYTWSNNSVTSKITATSSGGNWILRPDTSSYVIGQDENAPAYLLYQLGFFATSTFSGDIGQVVTLTGSNTYTANHTHWLNPLNIHLESSLVNDSNDFKSRGFYNLPDPIDHSYSTLIGQNNVLVSVPVTTNYGNNLVWQVGNKPEVLTLNRDISQISFTLRNSETNLPIDLNGRNFTVELIFST